MGLRLAAGGILLLLTSLAGVNPLTSSDYDLWRARRDAKGYEVWHWGGAATAKAAARVAELMELHEGKPAVIRDVSTAIPERGARGHCAVLVGVASGAPWKNLTSGVKGLDEFWKARAAAQPAFSGAQFFSERAGSPVLGLVAVNESTLLAAVAEASMPGAPAPVPAMPVFRTLDESRFVEWSSQLPGKADHVLGFVEYSVSKRDTSLDVVKELHAKVVKALERFESIAGPVPKDMPKVQVVLYNSLSGRIVNTGVSEASTVHFVRNSIEAVHGNEMRAFEPADVVRLVAHRVYGFLPNLAIEDGLPRWCGAGDELDNARALWEARLQGSLEDLTSPKRRGTRSPRLLHSLDFVYADLASRGGPLGPWLRGEAPLRNAAELEPAWGERVKPESRASRPRGPNAFPARPLCALELRAPAGNQYSVAGLGPTLARARGMGASHVVLTTFRKPGERQDSFGDNGGPTDADIEFVAATARVNGLGILLQTNLLGVRRGGWIGDPFKFKSNDWGPYFDELGEVWAHDGLLARQYCDGWILGHAFRGTTDLTETVARWRDWIARLRTFDAGLLGYVASWRPVARWTDGEASTSTEPEFEKVGFWKDLDFIGIDAGIPLGEEGRVLAVSEAPLSEILDKAQRVAAAADRPLVLFGVGYPATSRGHETPWRRNGEPALASQTLAFGAALSAVKAHVALRGVVISAFPPALGLGSLGSDWFSPVGRPAEASVGEIFSTLQGR